MNLPEPSRQSIVIAPEGTFLPGALDEAANRAAGALLRSLGAVSLDEARVAFCCAPGFGYLAALLGIWRAGGIAVPLAVSHPPPELEYVARDSAASIVVSDRALAGVTGAIATHAGARFLDTDELLTGSSAPVTMSGGRDRRALIVYTSGTTARPKGVVTTHATLSAQVQSLVTAWEWTAADRALLVLPLHHVHGIVNVVGCALTVGATLEMLPEFDADRTWSRLASGDISVFTAVPTIYRRLIQSWDAASPSLRQARSEGSRRVRLMMSGSAALPVATLDRWREITGHTLLERYGMTEIGMALSNALHGERFPGCVGRPLPGVETQVVDDAGVPVADGVAGELEVRGPTVFREYWRRPEETTRAFRAGWFRTGDVAVVEDGVYRLLGRTSVDIIKTGGYKVSALEIEEIVREHPSVADCAVVGIPDPEWGECVCIAVELRPSTMLGLEDLQAWTRSRLAPYKIPRRLCCVPAMPRNAMGKVVKPDVARLFYFAAGSP